MCGFMVAKSEVNAQAIRNLHVPEELKGDRLFAQTGALVGWENELLSFFSTNYGLFTPYPDYFKMRCYEFRILRQLLPSYFDLNDKYDVILEIGCGFGFKSLLLSPFCDKLIGVDIPEKHKGYVKGDFKSSIDVAKVLVNETLGLRGVEFNHMWPDNLKVESDSVSLIFSEYVLEHIPKLPEAVKEMHRVLRKGGIMIHVVPNTTDAVLGFIDANVNFSLKQYVATYFAKLLKRTHSRPRLKPNALVIPQSHSEFLDDFSKQIEVYKLENYLFPMIDAGFKIEKIISTREHNNVIVARK